MRRSKSKIALLFYGLARRRLGLSEKKAFVAFARLSAFLLTYKIRYFHTLHSISSEPFEKFHKNFQNQQNFQNFNVKCSNVNRLLNGDLARKTPLSGALQRTLLARTRASFCISVVQQTGESQESSSQRPNMVADTLLPRAMKQYYREGSFFNPYLQFATFWGAFPDFFIHVLFCPKQGILLHKSTSM